MLPSGTRTKRLLLPIIVVARMIHKPIPIMGGLSSVRTPSPIRRRAHVGKGKAYY